MAKISKGRTIKQYLFWSVVAPSFYCCLFPIVYGGVGIRLERESSKIGLCCKEETGWFHNATTLFDIATEKNLLEDEVTSSVSNFSWMCIGDCSPCAISTVISRAQSNQTYNDLIDEYTYLGDDFGSTTMDRSLSRPSCHILVQMWFDVMRSVPGLGKFLSIFSLFTMII